MQTGQHRPMVPRSQNRWAVDGREADRGSDAIPSLDFAPLFCSIWTDVNVQSKAPYHEKGWDKIESFLLVVFAFAILAPILITIAVAMTVLRFFFGHSIQPDDSATIC